MEENDTDNKSTTANRVTPHHVRKKKRFLSPTSSFIQFTKLETDLYTDTDKELAELNPYKPYENRKMKTPITTYEATVHLLKGVVGSGVVMMPRAYYYAGVAIAVPGTIILGILYAYGIHVMLRMQYLQCRLLKTPFLSLAHSMKIACLNGPNAFKRFAWFAPYMVDFFLVTNQIGICVSYVEFTAETVKNVMEPRILDYVDPKWYIICIFIPVLLINYFRSLKSLTTISLVGNIFIAAALILLFYYLFSTGTINTDEVNMVSKFTTWPLFIGTVMFGLEAVGAMITLEHNMEHPEKLLGLYGIFPWCMVFIVVLYIAVGLCGYFKYGENTKETIMASLLRDHIFTDCVQVFIGLAIYASFSFHCFVTLEIIWSNYLTHYIKDPNKECYIEFIMRTVVVILIFVMALVLPHIDLLMALVGSVCLSMLTLVIPFLLELCTKWPNGFGCYYVVFFKDIMLIVIGFCMLVIAACSCFEEMLTKQTN